MDAPTKPLYSDSDALNPIPEEAQASSTGREEGSPNPSDEPMTTGDLVMDTLSKTQIPRTPTQNVAKGPNW